MNSISSVNEVLSSGLSVDDGRPSASFAAHPSPLSPGCNGFHWTKCFQGEGGLGDSSPSLVGSSNEDDLLEGTSREVDDLLAAVYQTLDIKEDQVEQSRHDLMYQNLKQRKARVFLVLNCFSPD